MAEISVKCPDIANIDFKIYSKEKGSDGKQQMEQVLNAVGSWSSNKYARPLKDPIEGSLCSTWFSLLEVSVLSTDKEFQSYCLKLND